MKYPKARKEVDIPPLSFRLLADRWQTDPSITIKPRFPKKLDGVSKPFKHSSKGLSKTETKRNMGNLLRPVHGPVRTGFSGDQKEIATLWVSSTDCPILSDILEVTLLCSPAILPKHLQGHIQLWLHMARSLWLKDSNYKTYGKTYGLASSSWCCVVKSEGLAKILLPCSPS